LLVVLEKKHN